MNHHLLGMCALVGLALVADAGAQAPTSTTGVATSPDGVRIAYETRGSARPDKPVLVFVHGWSCDRTYWKNQLGPFARDFEVVAVDLAGHGESGLDRKSWTMPAYGGDVAAVVRKLGAKRVILIGHSMGGDAIAEAARQLPGRVIGLIWVDTYKQLGAGRSPAVVDTFVSHLRADFVDSTRAFVRSMFVSTSDSALVEHVAADMSSAPPAIALPSARAAFSYGREMPHTLDELKLPVIAINPDNAPTDTASLRRYGVSVLIIPGVGHFSMLEAPERFNATLRTAIERMAP
jgi:pimeloyl-ACP methyl ester carboxylesterase